MKLFKPNGTNRPEGMRDDEFGLMHELSNTPPSLVILVLTEYLKNIEDDKSIQVDRIHELLEFYYITKPEWRPPVKEAVGKNVIMAIDIFNTPDYRQHINLIFAELRNFSHTHDAKPPEEITPTLVAYIILQAIPRNPNKPLEDLIKKGAEKFGQNFQSLRTIFFKIQKDPNQKNHEKYRKQAKSYMLD